MSKKKKKFEKSKLTGRILILNGGGGAGKRGQTERLRVVMIHTQHPSLSLEFIRNPEGVSLFPFPTRNPITWSSSHGCHAVGLQQKNNNKISPRGRFSCVIRWVFGPKLDGL